MVLSSLVMAITTHLVWMRIVMVGVLMFSLLPSRLSCTGGS